MEAEVVDSQQISSRTSSLRTYQVIDELESEELIDVADTGYEEGDAASMRENLRVHYMTVYGNSAANNEADEFQRRFP